MTKNYIKIKDYIFKKPMFTVIYFIFIIILFIIPSNAQIINGDFETGDITGWTAYGYRADYVYAGVGYEGIYGDYTCYIVGNKTSSVYIDKDARIRQDFSPLGYEDLEFDYLPWNGDQDQWIQVYNLDTSTYIYNVNWEYNSGWKHITVDVSAYQNANLQLKIVSYQDVRLDNVELTGYVYVPPPPLSNISFNPNVSESNESQQYFDYNVNSTYEDYVYFVTSVIHHPNYEIEAYQNILYDDMSGTNLSVENEFTFVPNEYSLRLYATPSYPAFIQDGILIAETDTISITSNYTAPNATEPEIPDVDINVTIPDIPTPPEHDINQTLNSSWSTAYYLTCDATINGLFYPMYNFTYYALTPIIIMKTTIEAFELILESSLNRSISGMQNMTAPITLITNSIHSKVQNLISYFLVWTIILLIMRKR